MTISKPGFAAPESRREPRIDPRKGVAPLSAPGRGGGEDPAPAFDPYDIDAGPQPRFAPQGEPDSPPLPARAGRPPARSRTKRVRSDGSGRTHTVEFLVLG